MRNQGAEWSFRRTGEYFEIPLTSYKSYWHLLFVDKSVYNKNVFDIYGHNTTKLLTLNFY